MFFRPPGEATKIKKIIYLMAATILGLLLSFLIHALIEINYLRWLASQNIIVSLSGGCALALWLNISLWLLGAVGGFFLGRFWWRKLYIERVWVRNRR